MKTLKFTRSIFASAVIAAGLSTTFVYASQTSETFTTLTSQQTETSANPIYQDTAATSMFLNKGQRKITWMTFSHPTGYDQLAALVAISYGDLLSVSCQISLYDGNSTQAFKTLNCASSQQWNPTTPNVPVLPSTLRAKIEHYNADFTKPSKQVSLRLTPNFANQEDLDQDGMPAWFEILRNLSDSNALDAASDRDQDGYTALEEYLGGSHPLDNRSTPANP
ncbi:hypothetical protein Sden_2957 [Shewanella denitrificans OS217]|uniref:Uncharacterized protein n=1 Tax=Shewanella denitrificans (strain OS217 / ATCC BAA-1090 / DSM 15013) TaxID=318161 RepID=Q12JZ1_SHEDO|nr:hypothetical protein [Shewanella denitrificans]ABE56235.1 hypothetical protein Sden_2957 [Shewanella denitrificans OS217]